MKKILILVLGMLLAYPMMAQVKVPFTQRTSLYSPTKKIFNIKGDFQMIGNTNLTLVSYGDNTTNSQDMKYVDIDGDPQTLNSSSATLSFSTENGAQPACSNIIYAGLYWTGRAHNGDSDHTFSVTKSVQTTAAPGPINATFTASNSQTLTNTSYSLSVSRLSGGGTNNYYVGFTFESPIAGQPKIEFEFRNGGTLIRYKVNDGNWIEPGNQVYTNSGDTRTATFDPVTIYSGAGINIVVDKLVRDSRQGRTENQYRNSSYAYGSVTNGAYFTTSHNGSIGYTDYKMVASRQGSNNSYITRYTFSSTTAGQPTVLFELRNTATNNVYYSTNNGSTWTQASNQSTSDSGNNRTTTFDPVIIYSPSGGILLAINQLTRDSRTDRNENTYTGAAKAYGYVTGSYSPPTTISVTKNYDKSVVWLKHAGQPTYFEVKASVTKTSTTNWTNNIYYPYNSEGYMYSAYAEVTDYVKEHGIGEYFVADMALREGNGGNTGYYGGWGMIVVYENSKMKWRDVTIFDGHAYIYDEKNSDTMTYYELPVSGFHTAQNGDVNMKVGIIAGEGDRGIGGGTNQDIFEIRNHQDNAWLSLSTTNNPATNFFASSIVTDGTRNPSLYNNTGLDIVNVNVPTTALTNNQTSTKFRYGTNQDTYIISTIAMAVDSYVPDLVPTIEVVSLNGSPISSSNSAVTPGQDIEYVLELKNPGNEAIKDVVIDIPIPYNASYVSATAQYWLGTGAPGNNQPQLITGSPSILRWNIGSIPKPSDPVELLAKLTFKLKATTDCFILVNEDCLPVISVEGSATGSGVLSKAPFNIRFIKGYKSAPCTDEPILGPIPTEIDAEDYVNTHCAGTDYTTRSFEFCKPHTGNLNFTEIASFFPAGIRFFSAIVHETADTGIEYVKPAENATEYTFSNSFPATEGTISYYALPSGATTCYWKFNIVVTKCNLWMGNTSTTNGTSWSLASNWTNSIVPTTDQDVEFATVANYGVAAVNDLYLDQNRSIGNLKNQTSNRALVVTNNNRLIITKKAIITDVNSIRVQSKRDLGNGSLIFTDLTQNAGLQATVEFDSKSQRVATGNYPREWQYIGSPIIGAIPTAVFGSDVSGSKDGANESIRKYNEAKNDAGDIGDKWDEVTVTAPMASFAGYEFVQNARDAEVYQYKGTLHLSDFSTPDLGFTSGVYYRGNYILANSYTAPIKISKLTASDFENLEQAIYLYNTGSRDQWLTQIQPPSNGQNDAVIPGAYFGVPTLAAGTLHDNLQIPSMNGFLVRRLGTGYNSSNPIKFNFRYASLDNTSSATQAMRVKQTGSNSNEQKLPLLKISVQGSTWNDYTYLITAPETSKEFDNGWDSRKILTASDDQIYVINSTNERFQVSSDENINGTTLGFYRKTSDTRYTMKFYLTGMENVYSDLYLEDLATGTQTRIADGATYSFNADAASPESRFRIHASRIGDIVTGNNDAIVINYYNDKTVTALNSTDEKGTLNVMDLAGKTLISQALSKGITQLKANLPNGVYIIEAKTVSCRKNLKIVIQ